MYMYMYIDLVQLTSEGFGIFSVMSSKRMVVSIVFSRKRALAIMCRQYVVQFQLRATRLLRFIDFLLAVERT